MKQLFILRGLPGSGKSSFVKQNKLENYTLSTDSIRLQLTSPSMNASGEQFFIRQNVNNVVYKILLDMLEMRMKNAETTLIDATNIHWYSIKNYVDLAKRYNYEVCVIDFYHPLRHREIMYNNINRESFKRVPIDVIEKMTMEYNLHTKNIQSKLQVYNVALDPMLLQHLVGRIKGTWEMTFPLYFEEVVVFGDVHGCSALKHWFDYYKYDPKKHYYFLGDYFDRGNDILNTFDLLYDLSKEKNVHLIEGNHEKYLRMFAYGEEVRFNEFKETTQIALQNVPKEKIRELLSTMQLSYQFTVTILDKGQKWLKVPTNTYYLNHGGIPVKHKTLTSGYDLINGAGSIKQIEDVAYAWQTECGMNEIQICGHRGTNKRVENQELYEHKLNDYFYCLENEQYIGGDSTSLAYLPVMRINPSNYTYISDKIDNNGIYTECFY